MRALVVMGAIAMLVAASTPAAAQGSWCSDDMVSRNCGFYTLAQCQAHASGNAGYCSPNPFAPSTTAAAPKKRTKRATRNR
jgi:Protein of unknown function (DUF3551)